MKIARTGRVFVGVCLVWLCVGGGRAPAAQKAMPTSARVIFLHHSTGECIWNGGVPAWFTAHNAANKTRYAVVERSFPKDSPYGWENYPYDYWNIWVKHAGGEPFKEEPTLEMLTAKYDVIVLKHCFPVSSIEADAGRADVASAEKRIANYKLQYAALKKKMLAFPKVRFIVWTPPALLRGETDEAAARRAKAFSDWVRNTWDTKGDNIYLWDFRRLESEDGLYLKAAHASDDSHPNETFSKAVAPLLCRRIVDIIRGRGDAASITGQGGKTAAATLPASAPARLKPPRPPAPTTAPAAGAWVFDNAEHKAPAGKRWGPGAAYAKHGPGNAIKINFAAGEEQDWGEYGKQRLVFSRTPAANYDLAPYRYLALRMKADRAMEVVVTLLTLPAPQGSRHDSHFGFSGYVQLKPGAWKAVVLDLAKLELAAEGSSAYEKAGKPSRPMRLTYLRLCTSKKNEQAEFLIDDVAFLPALPEPPNRPQGSVQTP